MPNGLGQARKARPASFPIILPCTHATWAGTGISLPLPGMKTSTALLKGPTPPLVMAATRTEQVALVATTGRTATLAFCRASAETFCWKEEGKKSLGRWRQWPIPTAGGKSRDLLRLVLVSNFCAALLSQAQRKHSSKLLSENNSSACKSRMGSGKGLSSVSRSNLMPLSLFACQQQQDQQPEPEERQESDLAVQVGRHFMHWR